MAYAETKHYDGTRCRSTVVQDHGMKFTFNTLFWMTALFFLGAALFFTVNIGIFKAKLNQDAASISFASGQKVVVAKIIDGDEISVTMDGRQFIVRLMGIQSWEAAVDDPTMENVGKDALRYLDKVVMGNEVELRFESFRKDRNNRVLAYVYKNNIDVGLDMVTEGLTLVYSRYPFPRMAEYLTAEELAMKQRRGLWGIPAAAARAQQLIRLWESQLKQQERSR